MAYGLMSQYTAMDWPSWTSGQIPSTTGAFVQTLDTAERQSRNPFFWGPEARSVMTKDLVWDTLDWSDIRRSRIRHWLTHTENEFTHWGTLSWEQQASPDADGSIEGAVTWYDYVGLHRQHHHPPSYTNQINLITLSAYDAAGRKTNEIQVGVWTNRFTYSPAGDLLSLTDGKNQTTSWVYDNDGRVKEKWYQGQSTADLVYSYNANGLLINRLTRTGTGASTNGFNTVFRYNPVGSLTNVDYPAGTDLQFEYDVLQRRTKMVDAIGTTTYTYTVGSGRSLIAEDGPWASDTLTVTNRLGRRLGLHLQRPLRTD